MEPIPETADALAALDAQLDEGHLLDEIIAIGERVREVVPDCVGLSLAYIDQGITLTLVATSTEIAVLDAIQYVAGGPCVDSVAGEQVIEFGHDDVMDEARWRLFSEATSAAAVRSTLTLPVVTGGRVTGSVNLYGASVEAFTGHHIELADILGAWAPAAVSNADLAFTTRRMAKRAPGKLAETNIIDTAVGMLMATGLETDEARRRLDDAAARGGITTLQLAKTLLQLQLRRRKRSE